MITTLRRVVLTLGAAMLLLTAGTAPAAAATPLSFTTWVYSACVQVHGDPTALGQVSQLTSTGTVLETREVSLDGSGDANFCFDQPSYPGMQIRGVTGGVTRTLTLPKLGISVDRTTDVIKGTAPAGKQVKVWVTYDPTFSNTLSKTFTRTASSTGTWSADTTSSFNLLGGDSIQVEYTTGPDVVWSYAWVPNIQVRIGSANVQARVNAGQGGSITLRNSAGTLRGRAGIAGRWYAFDDVSSSRFVTSTGSAVSARIGDKVSAPFQPSMAFTIPTITITANPANDGISGSCPANRRMHITVVKPGGGNQTDPVTCSSTGIYGHVMSNGYDVETGDLVVVVVRVAHGDLVERRRLVP